MLHRGCILKILCYVKNPKGPLIVWFHLYARLRKVIEQKDEWVPGPGGRNGNGVFFMNDTNVLAFNNGDGA